jgi:hypothetical protein
MTGPVGRADWTRRELLRGALAVGVGALLPGRVGAAEFELPEATAASLGSSGLVYISPLLGDGRESRCHGEVWFLYDGGGVLIATAGEGWKARSLARGRDRARLWVGDLGPIARARPQLAKAPSFVARARLESDPAAFQRLLEGFARKYAREWGRWEARFRDEYNAGERVLIRYAPISA